ncbi:MAG TPA: thermonuclease family protein [Pirellulales bacterium]|jgi:micrococcal nuclease|nr:thermonuclease family protein [Pirellulales bacterium]
MSRRFRPPSRSGYVWLIVIVLVILLRYWGEPAGQRPHAGPDETLPLGQHHVVRVIDGDTIMVDPHARVRLIGVNAPETVKPDWPVEPWGPEASAFTKQFLSGGTVRLEFDDEPRDAYDRYLAYVWVDGQMLNEALLRAGLARFEPNFHYSSAMKRRFRQAQDEARHKHFGIWSNGDSPHHSQHLAPSRASPDGS